MSAQQDIRQLQKALEGLAYAGAQRASTKGIRAGMKVVEKAIAAAAPVGSPRKVKGKTVAGGAVKRSVGSRVQKNRGADNVIRAKAGLNVGKGKPVAKGSAERKGNQAYHAHFVGLGTAPRWRGVKYGRAKAGRKQRRYDESQDALTGGRVSYTGVMPANSFVLRATQASESAAIAAMTNAIAAEIPKEVARARRGA